MENFENLQGRRLNREKRKPRDDFKRRLDREHEFEHGRARDYRRRKMERIEMEAREAYDE